MKQASIISVLILLVVTQISCGLSVSTPPGNQSIGQIEKLQGGVQAGPASSLIDVESLRIMYNNDAVHVYNNGKAKLDFGHGLAFTLYNDTVSGGARVDDGGTSRQAEIRLSAGGLKAYNPPGSETRVTLPNDVNILILGTHYFVIYDPVEDETWVYNFDGLLQYELPPGGYQVLSSGTLLKIDDAQVTHLYYGFTVSEEDFDIRATSLNSPIQAVREIVKDGPVIPVTGATGTPTNTPSATSTLTSTPTATQTPTPTATPIPCYSARFVVDVTIPDGSMINPNTSFTKTWRLRNMGSCTWDSSYQIVFVGGTQMSASASDTFKWTAGIVGYGQTADITVNLVSPRTPGTYQGNFMLLAPNGTYFGLGVENKSFWVRIVVPEPNTPPPAPMIVSPLHGARFCEGSDILLKWNESNDPSGIAAYKIQVWRDNGLGNWESLLEQTVSSSSREYTITKYSAWSYAYAWDVLAQDGEGAWSESLRRTNFYIDSCPIYLK